jgi:hypothetical protein
MKRGKGPGDELTVLFASLVSAGRELPAAVVELVCRKCFSGRSMPNSSIGLGALRTFLRLGYALQSTDAILSSIAHEAAALIEMEPEALESILQVVKPEQAKAVEEDAAEVESEDAVARWLKTSARGESEDRLALFTSKWTQAEQLSQRAIASVDHLAEVVGVPGFFLDALALGTSPLESAGTMRTLCEFLGGNLGWPADIVDCLRRFATASSSRDCGREHRYR